MKRYNPIEVENYTASAGPVYSPMIEDPNGEWCKVVDVLTAQWNESEAIQIVHEYWLVKYNDLLEKYETLLKGNTNVKHVDDDDDNFTSNT